ncbi:MAG: nitroreductase [Betaproteobacteria bacterium]|nr:nitroreductase [Betaproteobacteria bacterium]
MHRDPPSPAGLPPEGAPVAHALLSRRSVRGFLPTPVPRAMIEGILYLAARAPSGTNCQPWKVYVCTGAARDRLVAALRAAHDAAARGDGTHVPEYAYYPAQWREPYLARRRALGWDYYGIVGIGRGDRVAMQAQHAKNFAFFGAPVGLFFTLDRDLERGSWLDTGMFIEGVMIAARAYGLHTCPQAAFLPFHRVVRRELAIPEGEVLLCGMSLGTIDEAARENALTTTREPVAAFARFRDD